MIAADPILPGAVLGVLGGGQLGRMFVLAAARMGYRTAVFTPEIDSPAGQIADRCTVAHFEDDDSLAEFASRCDAVTIEFENVPVPALERVSELTRTRPGPGILAVAQNRSLERAFLDRHGLPCAAHAVVRSAEHAADAARRLGAPAVLKSTCLGYDGKGQRRVDRPGDAPAAWHALGVEEALYELWVEHRCEVSVLVARSGAEIRTFGPIENLHSDHILDLSVAPARVSPEIARQAVVLARDVAAAIDLQGLICVEMFVLDNGSVLINELAPRPHNSGHLTIEACDVSQFEQQVRALCALPLGDMSLRRPAAMANLLGHIWSESVPCWPRLLAEPGASLHLYGKSHAAIGRKMGHVTVCASSAPEALRRAQSARSLLTPCRDGERSESPLPEGIPSPGAPVSAP